MKKLHLLVIAAALFLAPAVLAQDPTPTAPKPMKVEKPLAVTAAAADLTTAAEEAPAAAEAPAEAPAAAEEAPAAAEEAPAAAPTSPTGKTLWDRLGDLLLGAGFDMLAYLIMALLGLISTAFGFLAKWIAAKTGSERLGSIAERLGVALERAVKATWQTYAEELKKGKSDGKLTDDEKAEARKRAIVFAKDFLGPKGIREFLWAMGIDESKLDGTLGDMIEHFIAKSKDDSKAAANPT
jgi:pyruvate/2-oxoglutarate dehydrogenase complex dihydrolipoamide acyltransferase (E2) component